MIKKTTFILIAVSLSILLINMLFALYERVIYGAFWEDGRPKGLYVSSNADRPQLKPGAHLNGLRYDIQINSLGFRGSELGAKPADGIRIWCIGGSTTFDIYAPDNESTWPALLEAKLNKAQGTNRVEVINAGVPGEVYWGSKQTFLSHLSTIQPDMVLLYHGPNDLRRQAELMDIGNSTNRVGPQHIDPTSGGPPPVMDEVHKPPLDSPPLFVPGNFALGRAIANWTQSRQQVPPQFENNVFTREDFVALEREVMSFVKAARQNNVQPILITHPMRASTKDKGQVLRERAAETVAHFKMPPQEITRGFFAYNQMLHMLAKRESLQLIDLAAEVGPEKSLWGDATHFSAAGSELASSVISRDLAPILHHQP